MGEEDESQKCSEGLRHNYDEDTGRCRWCKHFEARNKNPLPQPRHRIKRSELTLAYGYYYDVDFGLDRHDIY